MTAAGVTGMVAAPAAIPTGTCFAMGSGVLGLAGTALAPALSGAASAALDPLDLTTMFAAGNGKPLRLNNVLRSCILPVLNRCAICGVSEDKHAEQSKT